MINATSAAGDEKDSFSSSVSGIPAKIKIISDPLLCKVLVLTILKYLFTHTIIGQCFSNWNPMTESEFFYKYVLHSVLGIFWSIWMTEWQQLPHN